MGKIIVKRLKACLADADRVWGDQTTVPVFILEDAIDNIANLTKQVDDCRAKMHDAQEELDDAWFKIDAITKQRDDLLAALIESRSSVKLDLTHYEKLARGYASIGDSNAPACEAEANRLRYLIDRIDAIAAAKENK